MRMDWACWIEGNPIFNEKCRMPISECPRLPSNGAGRAAPYQEISTNSFRHRAFLHCTISPIRDPPSSLCAHYYGGTRKKRNPISNIEY
jgi:hypothetical protein